MLDKAEMKKVILGHHLSMIDNMLGKLKNEYDNIHVYRLVLKLTELAEKHANEEVELFIKLKVELFIKLKQDMVQVINNEISAIKQAEIAA